MTLRIITVILFYSLYLPAAGQDTTMLSTNKKTIARYFNEVINRHKLDRIDEFFSPDFTWHQMNGTETRLSEDSSHTAMKRWLFTAIPDVHYTLDHITAEGDMVAINTTVTGIAKAEMFGLPAAEKKVRFRQMFFYRFYHNKIIEQWEVVDVDGLKAQIAKQ